MVMLVKLIGMLLVSAGVVFLVKPDAVKKLLAFFAEGDRVYGIAAVRIIIGSLLIVSARECASPWIVAVVGFLPFAGGIVILVMGAEKSKEMIKFWQAKPEGIFRKLSLIPVLMGALLVLAA